MTVFAAIVAFYAWKLALESFATDARAMSFLRTPLFVPQGVLALGFTAARRARRRHASWWARPSRCAAGRSPRSRCSASSDLTEGL